jgi:hypothetical protein
VATDPRTLLHLAEFNAILFAHLDESQVSYGLTGEKADRRERS